MYGKDLFKELKQVHQLAKQNISKAQFGQKVQYDKGTSEVKITEGDLVMLKVEPRFKLDRTYRGPYHVQGVTSTCATIVPINTPDGEVINVSLQRLLRCRGEHLSTVYPWMGHGRMHKRRQLRTKTNAQNVLQNLISSFDIKTHGSVSCGQESRRPHREYAGRKKTAFSCMHSSMASSPKHTIFAL